MAIYKFSPKDPSEVILATFDFSNLLNADINEKIQSALWSSVLAPIGGNSSWPNASAAVQDPNPSALISGTTSITDTTTSNYLSNGYDKNTYRITAKVVTNMGQTFKLSADMLVEVQQ